MRIAVFFKRRLLPPIQFSTSSSFFRRRVLPAGIFFPFVRFRFGLGSVKHWNQQRVCIHCSELFLPDRRNRYHQQFCNQPECRQGQQGPKPKAVAQTEPGLLPGRSARRAGSGLAQGPSWLWAALADQVRQCVTRGLATRSRSPSRGCRQTAGPTTGTVTRCLPAVTRCLDS